MDLKNIVEDCFEKMVEECVKEIIEKHAGYGIETDIKAMIKEATRKILDMDEEIQKLLKESIIYWIKQT